MEFLWIKIYKQSQPKKLINAYDILGVHLVFTFDII